MKVFGMLVVLIVIVLGCVIPVEKSENIKDEHIAIFYSGSKRVQLNESEFDFIPNKVGGDFCVDNKEKVKLIKGLKNPKLEFYVDGICITAFGINVSSSEIPNKIDWFFFKNDGGIVLITGKNCIPLRKVIESSIGTDPLSPTMPNK